MHPMTQNFSSLPHRRGVRELTAADAKSLKVFNQETSSMGRKESVESVLSVYKKKD